MVTATLTDPAGPVLPRVWDALWVERGPALQAAALDASVAQVATEAAMGDWA